MIYGRAMKQSPGGGVGVRDRKSWPHVLSPRGEASDRRFAEVPLMTPSRASPLEAHLFQLEPLHGGGVEAFDFLAHAVGMQGGVGDDARHRLLHHLLELVENGL